MGHVCMVHIYFFYSCLQILTIIFFVTFYLGTGRALNVNVYVSYTVSHSPVTHIITMSNINN